MQDDLSRLTGLLASCGSTYVGFEARLGCATAQTDFAISLNNDGLLYLAAEATELPRIRRLCQLWGETGSPPFSDGAALWLEFDLSDQEAATREPSVFFALLDPRAVLVSTGSNSRNLDWICKRMIPEVWRRPINPALEHNLRLCAAACPLTAERIQIGLMLSRNLDGLRFCAFRLSPAEIHTFLKTIGWPGNEDALAKLLGNYAPLADSLCMHIDLANKILPTIGIELQYHHADPWEWQPEKEPRWYALFDRMIQDGLCLEDKRKALLAWPARTEVQFPLIERLVQAARASETGEQPPLPNGVLVTGLQHVKFSLSPQGHTSAKVYFGARYEPEAA